MAYVGVCMWYVLGLLNFVCMENVYSSIHYCIGMSESIKRFKKSHMDDLPQPPSPGPYTKRASKP
jgi:hypothetical protein